MPVKFEMAVEAYTWATKLRPIAPSNLLTSCHRNASLVVKASTCLYLCTDMLWSDTIINPYIFPAYFCLKLDPWTIFYSSPTSTDIRQTTGFMMDHYMQQPATGRFTLSSESLHCLTLSSLRSLFANPGYRMILFMSTNATTVMAQIVKNDHLSFCSKSARKAIW